MESEMSALIVSTSRFAALAAVFMFIAAVLLGAFDGHIAYVP